MVVGYRRGDAAGVARGMRHELVAKFGKSNMFMDVDNLRWPVLRHYPLRLGTLLNVVAVYRVPGIGKDGDPIDHRAQLRRVVYGARPTVHKLMGRRNSSGFKLGLRPF
jgi:hypothetical protein